MLPLGLEGILQILVDVACLLDMSPLLAFASCARCLVLEMLARYRPGFVLVHAAWLLHFGLVRSCHGPARLHRWTDIGDLCP